MQHGKTITKRKMIMKVCKPSRSALASNANVMKLVNMMKGEEGYEVTHDTDAGTITARFDEDTVYVGVQKGASNQPWIVTYSTDYFGG